MSRFLKFTLLALMACGLSTPAWATLTMQWGTGFVAGDPLSLSGGASCADGDGTCDTNALGGRINWNIAGLGTLSVTTLGSGSQSPAGNISFTLDATPTATGTWYFLISDTGFTSPAPPVQLLTTVGGTSIGTQGDLASKGWLDGGNELFGSAPGGETSTATTTINAGTGSGSSGSLNAGNPYSLTLGVAITLTSVPGSSIDSPFQVNANLRAVPVPEPASMFLLGGALLVTGKFVRKKIAKV